MSRPCREQKSQDPKAYLETQRASQVSGCRSGQVITRIGSLSTDNFRLPTSRFRQGTHRCTSPAVVIVCLIALLVCRCTCEDLPVASGLERLTAIARVVSDKRRAAGLGSQRWAWSLDGKRVGRKSPSVSVPSLPLLPSLLQSSGDLNLPAKSPQNRSKAVKEPTQTIL